MAVLIAGRYDAHSRLGQGAMGEVFLATDTLLRRKVAIKRIRSTPGSDVDQTALERLRREAQSAALVHHPNVVTIHDLVSEDDLIYIVMEYVEGRTLADLIRNGTTLDPLTAARIGSQIAAALEAAHRVGVIHRDVKPANILLVDASGTAKLADFGIARSLGDTSLTGTGLLIGSISFMAPEVANGGRATAASDVYSLGSTLFAATEGHAPFAPPTHDVPPAQILARLLREPAPTARKAGPLAGLIGRMLATDPAERPAAAEARLAMESLTEHQALAVSSWPADPKTLRHDPPTVRRASEHQSTAAVTRSASGQDTPRILRHRAPPPIRGSRPGRWPLVTAAATVATGVALTGLFAANGSWLSLLVAQTASPSPIISSVPGKAPSSSGANTAEASPSSAGTQAARKYSFDLVKTVPIKGGPWGVAIDRSTGLVYVGTYNGGSVSVVDTSRGQVTNNIKVPREAVGLAVDSVAKKVYVGHYYSGNVTVIDSTRDRVVATISAPTTDNTDPMTGLAVTDDHRLYVPNAGGIRVIDGATRTPMTTTKVEAYRVAVDDASDRAFAPQFFGEELIVIDTRTNEVSANITVCAGPHDVAVDSRRGVALALCGDDVSVVDIATSKVNGTISGLVGGKLIAVDEDRGIAFVSEEGEDLVAVIDVATRQIVGHIPVLDSPTGMAVDSAAGRLYVANRGSDALSIIAIK